MKNKLRTLQSLSANDASATATLNANFEQIEKEILNTVSRDGTQPNYMDSDFDLNNHRIINVGQPIDDFDVVTKKYVEDRVGNAREYSDLASQSATRAASYAQQASVSSVNAANAADYCVRITDELLNNEDIQALAEDVNSQDSKVKAVAEDLENIDNASAYAAEAKQWAIGEPTEPEGHSAKYYSQQCINSAEDAARSALEAAGYEQVVEDAKEFLDENFVGSYPVTFSGTAVDGQTTLSINLSEGKTLSSKEQVISVCIENTYLLPSEYNISNNNIVLVNPLEAGERWSVKLIFERQVIAMNARGLVHTDGTETVGGDKTLTGNNTYSGSSTFTGATSFSQSPTVPTPSSGDSSSKVANTNFVASVASGLQTQINSKAADNAVAKLTGDQNIGGVKYFTDGIIRATSSQSSQAAFSHQNSAITKGTTPDAITESRWYFTDKNGSFGQAYSIGGMRVAYNTTGSTEAILTAFKPEANSTAQEKISITYPTSGSAYTYAPTPLTSDNSTKIATTAYVNLKLSPNVSSRVTITSSIGTSNGYTAPSNGFITVESTTGEAVVKLIIGDYIVAQAYNYHGDKLGHQQSFLCCPIGKGQTVRYTRNSTTADPAISYFIPYA